MGTRALLEQTMHAALRVVDVAGSALDSAKGVLLDLLIDDGDSAQTERGDVWGVAGLQARPKAGNDTDGYAKAVRWRVGEQSFVLATFDPREAEDVLEGEVVLHALGKDGAKRALVRFKPDGTAMIEGVEILVGGDGATEGIALGDVLKTHLDAVKAFVDAHTHGYIGGGTGSAPALTSPPTSVPLPPHTPLDTSPTPPTVASAKHKVEP